MAGFTLQAKYLQRFQIAKSYIFKIFVLFPIEIYSDLHLFAIFSNLLTNIIPTSI